MDARKILVIFIIAVLFGIFANSLADAIFQEPEYTRSCPGDYYYSKPVTTSINCTYIDPTKEEVAKCEKGFVKPVLDQNGCIASYDCDYCQIEFQQAQSIHGFKVFILMSILGLIAIILGIYLPAKTNPLHEWVGTGFMFGGLISIFIGTARFFSDLHKTLRPIIIFLELLLVLLIAYKKLSFKHNDEENTEEKEKINSEIKKTIKKRK